MKKLFLAIFYATAVFVVDNASAWTIPSVASAAVSSDDSVIVSASTRYGQLTPLKWLFLGTNYRKDWSTPVKMPLFDLRQAKGGFTIKELGGGQQTKSLKLIDKNGDEWVLRTIDKDVSAEAIPKQLRRFKFITNIVQDQISAAYPYAPLTLTQLAYAAKVPVTPNELYYVPDDPALGEYRDVLKHRVCLLEPEPETIIPSKSFNTDKAYEQIRADNRKIVLQEEVLKARLLDMLIADWDRHKNQWDWSAVDSNKRQYYYPIPEDRDQAFFKTNGLLSKMIRLVAFPNFIGFNDDGRKMEKLNYKVYSFDRYFMNQLTKADWERIVKQFQQDVNDQVIHLAVKQLPEEIYAIRGKEIEEKLIRRKEYLYQNALKYYDFLTKEAIVNGTTMAEMYKLKFIGDQLEVTIRDKKTRSILFSHTYNQNDTEEIQFWDYSENNDTIEKTGVPNHIKLIWLNSLPINKKTNKF